MLSLLLAPADERGYSPRCAGTGTITIGSRRRGRGSEDDIVGSLTIFLGSGIRLCSSYSSTTHALARELVASSQSSSTKCDTENKIPHRPSPLEFRPIHEKCMHKRFLDKLSCTAIILVLLVLHAGATPTQLLHDATHCDTPARRTNSHIVPNVANIDVWTSMFFEWDKIFRIKEKFDTVSRRGPNNFWETSEICASTSIAPRLQNFENHRGFCDGRRSRDDSRRSRTHVDR